MTVPGKPPVEPAVVEVAAAGRDQPVVEVAGERGRGQIETDRRGEVQRLLQVLALGGRLPARGERAVDHALAVHLQDARGREPALQRLSDLRRVRARALRQRERLRHRADGEADDDLVRGLGDLARSDLAHAGRARAHHLEVRHGPGDRRLGASGHDGQRTRLRSDLAARHRGVDVVRTAGFERLRERTGRLDRGGAHVDHQAVRRDAVRDAVVPVDNPLHRWRVRRHHDDHGRAFGHLPRRVRGRKPLGRERVDHRAAPIVDDDLGSGRVEVHGHRPAHQPEADESDDVSGKGVAHCVRLVLREVTVREYTRAGRARGGRRRIVHAKRGKRPFDPAREAGNGRAPNPAIAARLHASAIAQYGKRNLSRDPDVAPVSWSSTSRPVPIRPVDAVTPYRCS